MLYTYKGKYPENKPTRIRFPDGMTKTDNITDEDLALIGYRKVSKPPEISVTQKLEWSGSDWLIADKNEEDLLSEWNAVRLERDKRIREVEWRYARYYRHERLNLPQIDTIENLDRYVQALADITKQSTFFSITWPTLNP